MVGTGTVGEAVVGRGVSQVSGDGDGVDADYDYADYHIADYDDAVDYDYNGDADG